jgi:hypothetical protein
MTQALESWYSLLDYPREKNSGQSIPTAPRTPVRIFGTSIGQTWATTLQNAYSGTTFVAVLE